MNAKAHIYYSNDCEMNSASFALHCAKRYCKANRIDCGNLIVERLPSGALAVTGAPVHVSIGHSRGSMACGVHSRPIGIDLELQRKINYMRISRRFFLPEEADFVERNGGLTFFILWTMKESYFKFRGDPNANLFTGFRTVGESGLWLNRESDGIVLEPFCLDDKFMFCSCKGDPGFKLITL